MRAPRPQASKRYVWRSHRQLIRLWPLNRLENVEKKRTKVVLRAQWLVMVRVVRERWGTAHWCNTRHALFKYSTSFSLWSPWSCTQISLCLTPWEIWIRDYLSPFSLTVLIIYEYLLFCYNKSCIVLVSNHKCYQMLFKVGGYLLPFKIVTVPWRWWAKLCGPQSSSEWPSSYFAPALPTLKVLNVTNRGYVCMVN